MTGENSREMLGLRDALREFASERQWDQFHTPRNLAASICIESGELLERFQWVDKSSQELTADETKAIRHELADVLLYIIRLADKLGIDPIAAAHEKIAINALKYPVDKSRGSSRKYDQL